MIDDSIGAYKELLAFALSLLNMFYDSILLFIVSS